MIKQEIYEITVAGATKNVEKRNNEFVKWNRCKLGHDEIFSREKKTFEKSFLNVLLVKIVKK